MLVVEPLHEPPAAVVLRPADAHECALGDMTPEQAVAYSMSLSEASFVAKWDGAPVAYWGWMRRGILCGDVVAWLLTTPLASDIPIALGIHTRREFRAMLTHSDTITVLVDPDHALATKWLGWLGFTPAGTLGPFAVLRVHRKVH